MKILLISPDTPPSFWSFDQVAGILGKKAIQPPLGLITLAGLFPESYEFRFFDCRFQKIQESDWEYCSTVFISGMFVQWQGIIQTIREAKSRGKKVVVGGAWAFHFPEEAFDVGADIVVKGEAEVILDDLLRALENDETGLFLEAKEMADIRDLPVPRYDLLDFESYIEMGIQFSRGCPFQCEFCDVTVMFGRNPRFKTPEQIIRELDCIYELGWRKLLFFVDDNFIANTGRAKSLLAELTKWQEARNRPFSFNTQASVNLAKDDELLDLMVKAGFYKVFLGIETTDSSSHELSNKTQNVGIDLNDVCRKINRAGLQITAGCILGFDNEKSGADTRFIEFANGNRLLCRLHFQ